MKVFETRYGAGAGQEQIVMNPHQEALWTKAFGVDSITGLFDLATAAQAIPVIDQAILRFNHDPEALRPSLDASDTLGLRGNRMLFEQMRRTLADHDDATISGVIEDS